MSRLRTQVYNYRSARSDVLKSQRAQNRGLELAKSRLAIIVLGFIFCFLLIVAQLVNLMILKPEEGHHISEISPSLIERRADIVGRNGEILATSLKTVSLYADPKLVIEPDVTARKLKQAFPDLNEHTLSEALQSDRRFVWIKRHLTPRDQQKVMALGLPGVEFADHFRRVYPYGRSGAHFLGFTDVDGRGIAGLEKQFEERLRGDQNPLELSLDIRLQGILQTEVEQALKKFQARGAAGLILDAKTSEVLAGVSLPDFDPNDPGQADPKTYFNRTTLGVYEMGSTFKIFNTAISLESGYGSYNKMYKTPRAMTVARHRIEDFRFYNDELSLTDVMVHSSNTGSAHIAQEFGGRVQRKYFDKLGLLTKPDIELPEVADPLLPSQWGEVETITLSFGYGLAVSPVQLVNAVAATVNGGVLRPVTILKNHGGNGYAYDPVSVFSEETSKKVRKILHQVVMNGTASTLKSTGYLVGGKTGTAYITTHGQGYARETMSSFIGAFPIHDPQYIVFVMLEAPKATEDTFGYTTGGWTAAPAVRGVVERIAPVLGVEPVMPAAPVEAALMIKGYKHVAYKPD